MLRRNEMANTLLLAQSTDPNLALVCFLGIAVVFVGLVILIGLVYLMNYLCDRFLKDKAPKQKAVAPVPVVATEIPNREELVAAIIAAVAEEEGTDISAIRVLSIKKV